jgi:hypothetical protein
MKTSAELWNASSYRELLCALSNLHCDNVKVEQHNVVRFKKQGFGLHSTPFHFRPRRLIGFSLRGRLCHESPSAQLSASPRVPRSASPLGVRSLLGEEEHPVSKVSKLLP